MPIRSRGRYAAVIGLAFLILTALGTGARAQSAGEHIADYDVQIRIEPDGVMDVQESITYDFGATARHGIFRDIVRRERWNDDGKYDRKYDISDVRVAAGEGTPAQFDTSGEGSYLRVKIGDPDRTITGVHRYQISYRLRGGPNAFADHDELYWDAIGTQWNVPIDHASVRVSTPAAITRIACFSGPEGSSLSCSAAEIVDGVAVFDQTSLSSFSGLTVVAAIPKGVLQPEPEPILDKRWNAPDAFALKPATLGAGGALALAGIGGVIALAWRRGRDRRWTGSAVDAAMGNVSGEEERIGIGDKEPGPVEFVPPDGVRPGQVGTLVDEHASLIDVTATIVDLAVRGWLRIDELERTGFFKRRSDYELHRTGPGKGELLPYEQSLLDALFSSGPDVKLSDLKYKFKPQLATIQTALYDDTVARGWYRARPDRTRMWWHALAIAALVVGVGLTVLVAAFTSFGIVPLALVVTGIVLLVIADRMPARTGRGSAMLSRVRGFRRLFDEGDEDVRSRFAEQQGIFSQYLPYAIVFGCTEKWARAFEGLDDEQLGTAGWYHGSDGFGALHVASAMSHFDTVATGTMYASAPSSSGGSGFSGGSSGGGGGGGGGGSW